MGLSGEELEALYRRHGIPQRRPEISRRELREFEITDRLSPRQHEVLVLIADGKTNKEIAYSLFVSEETVKAHVRKVLEALGVRSRAHAVARAFRADLIE